MAARFWVGGTGTWSSSNTANWAATSNGAGGASVPTSADAVTFDANSGTSFTVTVATGYNPTVASFAGGAATVTLNLNEQTLTAGSFNFSGSATRTLAFGTAGQINISGSGALVFTIQIDTNLTCTGSKNVYFTYSGGAGQRDVRTCTLASITNNGLNYYFQSGTDTLNISGGSGIVCKNFDFTGFAGTQNTNQMFITGNLTFSTGMSITAVAATWTFQGPSGGTQTLTMNGKSIPGPVTVNAGGGTVLLADNVTMTNTATLTLTNGTINLNNRTVSVGIFSSTGSGTRALAFGTSSVLNVKNSGTTVWNCATATNFSITGTSVVNFTYASNVGTRTISHGTTGVGGEVSVPNFNITAGSDIVVLGGQVTNLDFTGFTGTLSNTARTVYGNLTFVSGMTITGGSAVTTFGSNVNNVTLTTNGLSLDFPITVGCATNKSVTLADDLLMGSARTLTLTTGTLNTNTKTVTVGLFSSSGASNRTLTMTNSTVNLTAAGLCWNVTSSLNLGISGSTIVLANNTTTGRTFSGGTRTYNNLVIGGDTATNLTLITGSNTFTGTVSSTKTVAHTLQLASGTTTTVGGWTISGSPGNIFKLDAQFVTPANLVLTGGGLVNTVDYCDINYSAASPANTWYPGDNSTRGPSVTGWMFPETASSNFFLLF